MEQSYTKPSAQGYPGAPLLTDDHIRLLILEAGNNDAPVCCKLVVTTITSTPAYEALSYVWGDTLSCQCITIQTTESTCEHKHAVTSNCFSALSRLRFEDRPRVVWIDALCIDQTNNAERSHQITLMSNIYSRAEQVIIYLGEETAESNLAIDFIVDCDTAASETSLTYTKSVPLLQALNGLFRRPWFNRVWVIQEAAFARSATIICGTRTLDWSAIQNFDGWNFSTKWLGQLPFVVGASRPASRGSRNLRRSASSIMFAQLNNARHCQATDPQDKLYALLPFLCYDALEGDLTPNYDHSPSRIFTDFAAALVTRCGFRVLQAVDGSSNLESLPSWVPDWTVPQSRSNSLNAGDCLQDYFSASEAQTYQLQILPTAASGPKVLSEDATARTLQAFGYCCGQIAKMGSTYIASQGAFPLRDWEAIVAAELGASEGNDEGRDGKEDLGRPDTTLSCKSRFAIVISTPRGMKLSVINYFVDMEESLTKSGHYEESWDSSVRNVAVTRDNTRSPPRDVVSYREIPFHQAGKNLVASDRGDLQTTLRNCHSRRFFLTDTGFMGIAPKEAVLGDRIYSCVDARGVFMFRDIQGDSQKQDIRRVKLVGECHVDPVAWTDPQQRASYTLECLHIM